MFPDTLDNAGDPPNFDIFLFPYNFNIVSYIMEC